MSTTLNDTMGTAKHVLDSAKEGSAHAIGTAKHAIDSAKESTGHAVSSARTTFLDGVKVVTGVVTMLRALGVDDALGWVGLSRRRSPIVSASIFGAGVALGAGVGVLFAPMSGLELRRAILGRLMGPLDTAKDAVKKVEHEVIAGAEAVKEVVTGEVKAAAGAAKEAARAPSVPGNGHRPA